MRSDLYVMLLLLCVHVNSRLHSQKIRCALQDTSSCPGNSVPGMLMVRQDLHLKLVFHVLYKDDVENIQDAQIISQIQVLNDIYAQANEANDILLPEVFRKFKKTPRFHFCLAQIDPNGAPTNGITRTRIPDISIACKREFGKRSIMHRVLGGVDIWDPGKYINIYIVNREQCAVLGEAIYPWNANSEEDGIILDYRSVGFSGEAAKNKPFHQGKTLVHELGHYFGLYHLSGDKNNCSGDDLVDDTPPQAKEYFGCPDFPVASCTQADMYMNYMSYVDDDCMHFFTEGQVERMRNLFLQYRSSLGSEACMPLETQNLSHLIWTDNGGFWVVSGFPQKEWTASLTLFSIEGRLLWSSPSVRAVHRVIPQPLIEHAPGIYLLRLDDENERRTLKLLKY